jgi:hypothetical protein
MGHPLFADTSGGRVVEVDREGHVVWSVGELASPVTAQRLPGSVSGSPDERLTRTAPLLPPGSVTRMRIRLTPSAATGLIARAALVRVAVVSGWMVEARYELRGKKMPEV